MLERFARVGLLAIGVVLLTTAAFMSPGMHVDALRTAATAKSELTTAECDHGTPLTVTFAWHGGYTTQYDYSLDCGRADHVGDPVTIYVASNDPSNIGPDANWILNPDTHDPFDVAGPGGNPVRDLATIVGSVALGAGLAWTLIEYPGRRRSRGIPTH